MSTPKQIAANRLNAEKSAGPRSAQGKAASSANSLKTGLYARCQVIAGEDPAELRALADQYFLRWQPASPEESFLVATLVDAEWMLRRYSLADAKIWDYQGAADCVRDNANGMGLNFIRCREYFPLLQRRADSAQRAFHRALHDLERLQAKRRATASQPTPSAVAETPLEAKANFAQPQSDQQKIGFVPSFCPAPEPAPVPNSPEPPAPAETSTVVSQTVMHPGTAIDLKNAGLTKAVCHADRVFMKSNLVFFIAAALTFSVMCRPLRSADNETGPGVAAPQVPMLDVSPAERLPAWLQIGGQVRGRFEAPSGTSLANSSSDAYYLSRIRVNLGIKPFSWLKFFVQAQDARVGAYNTTPPATLYNPMDLRQGYVSISREGGLGLTLSAGRQELLFGGERLIGPADWGMSRTFDAVDLTIVRGPAKLDLFAGSPVLIDSTRFDRHKPGEHLYGAYGSVRNLLPGMTVEPYLLFKQTLLIKSETGVLGDGLVASPGVRVTGKTPGRLDYTIEALLQRGSYSSDRVIAMGQSYVAGWTIVNYPFKPRVSAEYSYASGDPTFKDAVRGTFDQFYPSNHGYYGMIDQFGWKNLKNWRIGFDCVPAKKLKLRTDFNQFYLATVQDSLYGSSGSSVVLNRKATSNHIGAEINTVALYQWTKIWKFGAGYGHLFAGNYLKQSNANFGYTYPYVMFAGSF